MLSANAASSYKFQNLTMYVYVVLFFELEERWTSVLISYLGTE